MLINLASDDMNSFELLDLKRAAKRVRPSKPTGSKIGHFEADAGSKVQLHGG